MEVCSGGVRTVFLTGTLVVLCGAAVSLEGCVSSGKQSEGHLAPPGEKMVLMQNEALDAFSAAQRYEGQQNYAAAAACYEKAMQYDEIHDTAYYRAGRCYALMGKWDAAEAVFLDLLSQDERNASIKDSLGYVYACSGKSEKAESLYRSLAEENPFQADFSYKYIKTLVQNGKAGAAERVFAQFKSTFPKNRDEIATLTALLSGLQGNSDTSAD